MAFAIQWPLLVGGLRLGFDERHDRQGRDAGAKGVVGAGRRGVDVEALRILGAAPGAVGPLIVEQELDAALDRGGDLLRLRAA